MKYRNNRGTILQIQFRTFLMKKQFWHRKRCFQDAY
ncbi:uncharacterized protein LOC131998580 [Stomoxys calcitrans]|nr:uncharacterized protein LOC131998580 [Stomoxys calcitrans]